MIHGIHDRRKSHGRQVGRSHRLSAAPVQAIEYRDRIHSTWAEGSELSCHSTVLGLWVEWRAGERGHRHRIKKMGQADPRRISDAWRDAHSHAYEKQDRDKNFQEIA